MSAPTPSRRALHAWRALPRPVRLSTAAALVFALFGGLMRVLAPEVDPLWQAPLNLAVGIPMITAVWTGARRYPAERLGWLAAGAGLVLTGIAAQFGMPSGHVVPPAELGLPDALWLARYPLLYGGLAVLMAARSESLGIRHALDGLIGAFAAGAVFALTVSPWMVEGAQAPASVVDVRSIYPLLDVLVLGFLGGAAVLNGWPMRAWLPLVLDIALLVVAEVIELRGAFLDPSAPIGWATFPLFLAASWFLSAAAFSLQSAPPRITAPRRPAIPALLLAAGAILTLMVASSSGDAGLAVQLAGASLLAGLARQALTLQDNNRLLALSRAEAATDALTGLANRRSLTSDLATAAESATAAQPLTLALFDLDGFKHYNDTFGHPAGDALLQRLGTALQAAVEPQARAYRMGGDEFCVLITDDTEPGLLIAAARQALADRGDGFDIGASCGVSSLPGDARDPMDALRLADHRMYDEKRAVKRRRTPQMSATAALLQVVRERDPSLGAHTHEVAGWAADVARALGADADTIEQARLGGELHDVGKTAIPDAILDKPGALNELEWEFMRRHTVIGERILLADPLLAPIAPVARSHHERWDGGGYPDGLAGEEIPLAARIVAVCDAYEAMIADRPYRAGRPPEEAVEELLRCAGGHFDPAVVDAFLAVVVPESIRSRACPV